MRNLKKFLALVLAMVMAMSLMVTANASSKFPDESEITPDLVEAVKVLNGLGVFKGQNVSGTEDGEVTFSPKAAITRKEVAALIYRVFSADVKDDKVDLYKDYANFTDVNENAWYAGYVGLCANHGIIKGSNNGRFYPDNNVTGYEVLAMILRVVGYDEEGEFTGTGWQTRVASRAALLHITDNLNSTMYGGTLNDPANREVVAELIFQTMVRVPMVTHTSLGYNDKDQLIDGNYNPNLGQEKFGLWHDVDWQTTKWGVPYYQWYKGGVKTGVGQSWYNGPATSTGDRYGYPIYSGSTNSSIATIYPDPDMDFTNTIRECDVAHTLEDKGFKDGDELFDLYVNQNKVENYRVEATDTVTRVGGQGRHTRIWYDLESKWFTSDLDNVVVMIDTFLAQVTRVTPRVLDHNGHVVQAAQADLVVYDRGEAMPGSDRTNDWRDLTGTGSGTITTPTGYDDDPINFINNDTYGTRCTNLTKGAYNSKHTMTNSSKDYTYTVGQYILVQGKTDPTQGNDWSVDGDTTHQPDNSKTGLYHAGTQAQKEKMAFETNMLRADPASDLAPVDGLTSVDAKQTSVTWNNGTHNVGNETKNDQLTLFMDYAGSNLSNTFTWYFDQYGNLIGIGPKANTEKYGVITNLYSAFKQGSAATTGEAVAMANVTYADGTTGTVEISKFIVTGMNGPAGRGTDSAGKNSSMPAPGDTVGTNPYPVVGMVDRVGSTAGWNTVELTPVYDYNGNSGTIMTADNASAPVYSSKDGEPEWGGKLYVAPVASINKANDAQDSTHYGIIGYNMFKFITTEDGVVTAIEIGGNVPGTGVGGVDNENSLRYDGHYHFVNGDNTNYKGTLNKTQGSITTRQLQTGAGQGGNPVWLESDVKIILNRNGVVTTYQGLSDLPSNITIDANSEVDWVDTDGDLRADYVYLFGETTGTVTYGLFYYNGGSAVWNGTSGTLTGWLNGAENTTLTFTSEAEFNAVRNSANYYGHMFAVRMMDGVVDELMMTDMDHGMDDTATSNWTYNLLWDVDNADSPVNLNKNGQIVDVDTQIAWGVTFSGVTATTTNKDVFKVGILGGNPYDEHTQIAYYNEGRTDDDETDIRYTRNGNQVYGTVTVRNEADNADETYYCGANTKYYGIGMGVTHGEAVLEYLQKSPRNDVTIVYDVTNHGILEIYVATDPNITPDDEPTADTSLSLVAMRNDGGNNLVLTVRTPAIGGETTAPGAGDTATLTLTNMTTGATLIGAPGITVTGTTPITQASAGSHEYTITIPYATGTTSTAGYLYRGTLSLTINGTTYSCTFSNWTML